MSSLQKLTLNETIIASLYENISLFTSPEKPAGTIAPEIISSSAIKTLSYLGANKQGIIVLVNYPDYAYLPDEQLNFLVTILQACKLTLEDVAIINCYKEPVTLVSLKENMLCNRLLLFGVDTSPLLLPSVAHFCVEKVNDCAMLSAPPLEMLNSHTESGKLLKSKLWLCLKQLFA
jgi:hypothetical protein